MKVAAYLEITMKINPENRPAAAKGIHRLQRPIFGAD